MSRESWSPGSAHTSDTTAAPFHRKLRPEETTHLVRTSVKTKTWPLDSYSGDLSETLPHCRALAGIHSPHWGPGHQGICPFSGRETKFHANNNRAPATHWKILGAGRGPEARRVACLQVGGTGQRQGHAWCPVWDHSSPSSQIPAGGRMRWAVG